MRKRSTKIICAAVAAISVLGMVFSSACSGYKHKAVSEKDNTASTVTSNGGFLVQTGDYVYFVNGKEQNTADNTFGSVVKGSVQRIKKSDLNEGNYSSTETIVPSVVYSGQYNGGIYIYGDYIYYTTPSTQKTGDGKVQNDRLDFRRTTLDGGETSRKYIWQSTDNSVDYRYVEVGGKVYILYAISENLYGTSAINIHSVNCETGENKILAYNVSSYVFDTTDPTESTAYYTMNVPYFMGGTDTYGYNQVYRVRADASVANVYDFSEIEDYDAEKDPVYINYGDLVFDGIGTTQSQTEGRVTQFNYKDLIENKANYDLTNSEYTYTLNSYENGKLYLTRTSNIGSTNGNRYLIEDDKLDSDGDGKVDASWNPVTGNKTTKPYLYLGGSTTSYVYYDLNGKTYAFDLGSSGITKGELIDGKVENSYMISEDTSATLLAIREESNSATEKHTYLYYSVSGGNGYSFNRIAIDGEYGDYAELSDELEWNKTWTYRSVKILDLDACSGWYKPEFVGNTVVFASETEGMSSYNYVMACNLSKDGFMMTNKQINDYNEQYKAIEEKIEAYNDETNTDGSAAFSNLANALRYLHNTGDEGYLDELIQAYVDIEGRDKDYLYSERSAEIYHEFAKAAGDWAEYKDLGKNLNGETVYANARDYYYAVLGKVAESDATAIKDGLKSQYMQAYPEDTSTWWDKIGTGGRVGFIIGMVAAGLCVIGAAAFVTVLLVKRARRKKEEGVDDAKLKVDITDDKSMNVYDD